MHLLSCGATSVGEHKRILLLVLSTIHVLIFFTFIKGYSIIAESSYFKTFLTRERFLPFSLCHILVTVQFLINIYQVDNVNWPLERV